MIIKEITIKNFRCYYGTQNIKFNTDGKITLLYGLSGAGKSSFLQFINWVFYNKNNFVETTSDGIVVEDKPLYNERLDNEYQKDDTFEVQGIIDFSHDGVDYTIIRTETFKKSFKSSYSCKSELILNYYHEGSWIEYTEDIPSKINEIVPKSLSKYFFFHGEKMNILNNEDHELKSAIYNLFGLNKYEAALKHLGTKSTSQTVIYRYYNEKNKMLKGLSSTEPSELFSKMAKCLERAEHFKKEMETSESRLKYFESKRAEKIKEIGTAQNSDLFEKNINANERLIKALEVEILKLKHELGNLFYRNIPYLMLSELTRNSVKMLATEAGEQEKNRSIVFKNLKKDLLKEILQAGTCVCGEKLSETQRKFIQETIDSMPPDSYNYQLKQFASKVSEQITLSREEYEKFNDIISKITKKRNEILELNNKIKALRDELKKIDNTKNLAEELALIESKIKHYAGTAATNHTEYRKYIMAHDKYEKEYNEAVKAINIKSVYDEKIELLERVARVINRDLNRKVDETVKELETSILEVYKTLSTRIEDFEKIKFLNDDFSLRRVNRTGGQEVIDVYSYIIGMIKALQSLNTDSSEREFPIIIDAPFSHTDLIQATHVFETLPKIASQVIVLSLEIAKFENSINSDRVGNIYVIRSNATQTGTVINSCNINELFELIAEDKKRAQAKNEVK